LTHRTADDEVQLGASVKRAAGSSVVLPFGTAVAAADDYSGKTYADASKAISDAGKKAVVASRAGDTLSDDQCIVSHSQSAPWIKGIAT
jgi:beta-lactam-binding protein with PASTA domain